MRPPPRKKAGKAKPSKIREDQNANYIHRLGECHKGKDIFVLGTGTSLAGFPWEKMNNKITIALNDAVKAEGFTPTYHLFSDVNIWKRYSHMKWKVPCKMVCQKHGRKLFLNNRSCTFKEYLWQFDIAPHPDLDKSNSRLHVRRTVACGGINMAYKFGANRIFLLGVDGYKKPHNLYYHDGTGKPVERRKENMVQDGSKRIVQDRHECWKIDMDYSRKTFKDNELYLGPYPESGVYNLNPDSVIESWEKVEPKEVLGFTW